jgi:hypothetical protein
VRSGEEIRRFRRFQFKNLRDRRNLRILVFGKADTTTDDADQGKTVSRNEPDRGKRVIGVNITSVDVERRSAYQNCIRFAAGHFGLGKDSGLQCENVVALNSATRSVIAT